MKKIFALALISAALLLTGCGALGGVASQPTYTPFPTYTPLPTYTLLPSPTATFLPSATMIPLETPTPAILDTPTPFMDVTATPAGIQAVLAFDSNLREGPGLEFDKITRLSAGELVTIVGRDVPGRWLFVRTLTGLEGWIKLTQFEGPIDVTRIPLAPEIPTPDVTFTPTPTETPAETPTPSLPAPSGAIEFHLSTNGDLVCETFVWFTPARFGVDDPNTPFIPFDPTNSASGPIQVFQFFRTFVPDFIDVYIQGDIEAGGCDSSTTPPTCNNLLMTLCASAAADAPTGGNEYVQDVTLALGSQSFGTFYENNRFGIPTLFVVHAP